MIKRDNEVYIPEDIPKILAIIPARGGSKGIIGKNLKMLNGKPLIRYILDTVNRAAYVSRVVVSTESTEIREYVESVGTEVIQRPIELAADDVPTRPVLQHCLRVLNETENYRPDYVMLVYPTSPLLSVKRINQAITMIIGGQYDSVTSVYEDYGHHWHNGQRLYPLNPRNRQFVEPLLTENGAIYVMKPDILSNGLLGGTIGFLVMDREENVDIDTMFDFFMAEQMMKMRTDTNNRIMQGT